LLNISAFLAVFRRRLPGRHLSPIGTGRCLAGTVKVTPIRVSGYPVTLRADG